MEAASAGTGGVPRVFALIRALVAVQAEGGRVTQLARAIGLTQGTTHRLLQSLVAEGMVEQDERSKLYRLSIDFFALAAKAGNPGDLRSLCRPVLLRLCASLGDSIFLLVRSGFDAVCLDRSEGPFPCETMRGWPAVGLHAHAGADRGERGGPAARSTAIVGRRRGRVLCPCRRARSGLRESPMPGACAASSLPIQGD